MAATPPAALGIQSHRAVGDPRALAACSRAQRERSDARRRSDARSPQAWALRTAVGLLLLPPLLMAGFLLAALVVKLTQAMGWG